MRGFVFSILGGVGLICASVAIKHAISGPEQAHMTTTESPQVWLLLVSMFALTSFTAFAAMYFMVHEP